jgi:hypothetical protein
MMGSLGCRDCAHSLGGLLALAIRAAVCSTYHNPSSS